VRGTFGQGRADTAGRGGGGARDAAVGGAGERGAIGSGAEGGARCSMNLAL
jgi:hypothetical protein